MAQTDVWTDMDNRFKAAIRHAEGAYRTTYAINLIIVGIGILFLLSSLYFAWIRGIDLQTGAYAGIGIADFTALFLVNPQKRIQQLLGDLSQIVMIYRTWWEEVSLIDTLTTDENDTSKYRKMDLQEISGINDEFNKATANSLKAIEDYIGADGAKKASNTKTQEV
jgi:hypothetical protein